MAQISPPPHMHFPHPGPHPSAGAAPGHGGLAPDIMRLGHDFAKMHMEANHAQGPKAAGAPAKKGNVAEQNAPFVGQPPVRYEGYTFCKAEPAMFGQQKTWSKVTRVTIPVSNKELQERARKLQQKKRAIDQYSELDKSKKNQIDQLIEDKRKEETDVRFEWKLAAVKTVTKNIGRSHMETTSMEVILARKLRPEVAVMATAGQLGHVVDLNALKANAHKEVKDKGADRSKGNSDAGHGFMHPGMAAQAGAGRPTEGLFGQMPPHFGEHPSFKPHNAGQPRPAGPEIVVFPEQGGPKQPRPPQAQQGHHPDIIMVPEHPPSRPMPQMPQMHQMPQEMPQQRPQMPQGIPQQRPQAQQAMPQQRPQVPQGQQHAQQHAPQHAQQHAPQHAQQHAPQHPQHQARPQKPPTPKPERKASRQHVSHKKSTDRVSEWLHDGDESESSYSSSLYDSDDPGVITPDSSYSEESRSKKGISRRGSLQQPRHRHSHEEDEHRPHVREHHRKPRSDPTPSRASHHHQHQHHHRAARDVVYTDEGYSQQPQRQLPLRRQSIAYAPEAPPARLHRPLADRFDYYDDLRDRSGAVRPVVPRGPTFSRYAYDEPDRFEPALPMDDDLALVRDRRGLGLPRPAPRPPVRRFSGLPYAPEPAAYGARERLDDRLYQQEMDRREHMEQMRRPVNFGYARMDPYGY